MLFAAEEEFTILLFEDNLIGEIELMRLGEDPEKFIDSYYALLEKDTLEKALSHRQELIDLMPRYNIAFSAADSAELAELMDEISFHWGAIKSVHDRHFSKVVKTLLDEAYDNGIMRSSL